MKRWLKSLMGTFGFRRADDAKPARIVLNDVEDATIVDNVYGGPQPLLQHKNVRRLTTLNNKRSP